MGQGSWANQEPKNRGYDSRSSLTLDPGPLTQPSHNLSAVTSAFDDIEIVPDPPEENEGVYLGMKVRHAKFGVGTIRKIEGVGEEQKAIVWFNSVGPKKLLLRFAGLERA